MLVFFIILYNFRMDILYDILLSHYMMQDIGIVGKSDGACQQLEGLEERFEKEIGLTKTTQAESREKISSLCCEHHISISTIFITFVRKIIVTQTNCDTDTW